MDVKILFIKNSGGYTRNGRRRWTKEWWGRQ